MPFIDINERLPLGHISPLIAHESAKLSEDVSFFNKKVAKTPIIWLNSVLKSDRTLWVELNQFLLGNRANF